MSEVIVYSTAVCPYCTHAKDLLRRKNIAFEEIRVDLQPELREELIKRTNRRTVPQIFINGLSIGGFDELYALDKQGQLTQLLER